MDSISLDEIERVGRSLESSNLIFPHHGGRAGTNMTAFSRKVFGLVNPSRVFFSIGRGLHGTPLPEVIVEARSREGLYVACTQLSERCSANRLQGVATHVGSAFASGRDSNSCCAGSIVLSLRTGNMSDPLIDSHQGFVSLHAVTALCRS